MQGRRHVDVPRAMQPAFDVADTPVHEFRCAEGVVFTQPTGPLGLRALLQTLIDDEALAIVDETFQRLRAHLPPGVDVAPLSGACRVLISTYGRLRAPTPVNFVATSRPSALARTSGAKLKPTRCSVVIA